jgi:hypothetical protein
MKRCRVQLEQRNEAGQMMIIESIFFAVAVLLALLFIYQISLSSTTEGSNEDMKTIGDSGLYTLYNEAPGITSEYPKGFPPSKLVQYMVSNASENLILDLKNMLPSSVMFNVYIANMSTRWFWCSSSTLDTSSPLSSINPVIISHCLVVIPPKNRFTKLGSWQFADWFQDSATYDVQLEMWSI